MISVIVATFGSSRWEQMGNECFVTLEEQTVEPISKHRVHGKTLAEARNEGAMAAKGEWLLFLDADDRLDKDYIKNMQLAIKSADNEDVLIRPSIVLVGQDRRPHVLPECDIKTSNFMIIGTLVKRSTFINVRGFRELPLLEDWDLWIRCHLNGSKFAIARSAVYYITVNDNSRNRQQRSMQMQTYNNIRRTYGFT